MAAQQVRHCRFGRAESGRRARRGRAHRFSRRVSLPSSEGSVPVSAFRLTASILSPLSAPNEVGIVPESRLEHTSNTWSAVSAPMPSGSGPASWLSERSMSCREVMPPSCAGIEPLRLFSSRSLCASRRRAGRRPRTGRARGPQAGEHVGPGAAVRSAGGLGSDGGGAQHYEASELPDLGRDRADEMVLLHDAAHVSRQARPDARVWGERARVGEPRAAARERSSAVRRRG